MTINEFLSKTKSNVSVRQIESNSHREDICIAREAWWYYVYKKYKWTQIDIAHMAERKRQTVASGLKNIENLLRHDHYLIEPYKRILSKC
jgi:chromosomal replication initiation ATPase DnaA